ncbi:hypothetical protein BGX33_002894, partial [Mortierella sp. NVP41]
MTTSSEPKLEDDTFIGFLFERIFFESVVRYNYRKGTRLHPLDLCTKLGYISRYYDQMSLKSSCGRRAKAINLKGINTTSGVSIYVANHANFFKVLPDRLSGKISLDFATGTKVCMYIYYPFLPPKDMVDIRRGFMSRVPEAYREEIDFLVEVMRRN